MKRITKPSSVHTTMTARSTRSSLSFPSRGHNVDDDNEKCVADGIHGDAQRMDMGDLDASNQTTTSMTTSQTTTASTSCFYSNDAEANADADAETRQHNQEQLEEGEEAGIADIDGNDGSQGSSGQSSDKNAKLTIIQASSVLVNYISVGYILLPAGFALGGTVLTPIIFSLVVLQAYICGIFVLEACARAEALENMEILQTLTRHGQKGLPRRYEYLVGDRKFELSELSRVFLGRGWRNFFTFTTCADLYGLTWALASVFGSALSNAFPISAVDDDSGYKIYVVGFMGLSATLSCIGIRDQVWLQLTFLLLRLLMVTLMLLTTVVAYTSSTPQFGTQQGPANDVPLFNFRETVGTCVICVFSTAYQFSVPSLTNETRNKKKMTFVIRRSISFVFVSNLVLSLVLCIFFGMSINESSNLNWVDYHGGTWNGEGRIAENRALWSTFISKYIVLFAAIDGLAVYPLCCISLGEIMMGTIFEETVHEIQTNSWKIRTAFRLLASVPQAIGALFVQDLGVVGELCESLSSSELVEITKSVYSISRSIVDFSRLFRLASFAGCFTLLSYTVCPCLLNIFSTRKLDTENEGAASLNRMGSETFYSHTFSSNTWSWTLVMMSLALIIGVIIEASVPGGSL